MNIDLDKSISKTFRNVVIDALNFNVAKIVMKGGRSSFKSNVAIIIVILGCILHKRSCLCIVKTESSSRDKLANNIKRNITRLGLDAYFEYVATNQRFVLLDSYGNRTKHVIRILGANNPNEVKSLVPDEPDGFAYTFVEEAGLFKSENDINSLFSTSMRGAGKHCFLMAYNPPMETGNFLNVLYNDKPCGIALGFSSPYCYEEEHIDLVDYTYRTLIHHSTYLDAIRDGHADWVGYETIGEYELQRKNNEKAWKWDKLGLPVGTEANVFWNITDWEYDPDISSKVESVLFKYGFDISNGGKDPYALVKCLWDPANRDLYILNSKQIIGNIGNIGSNSNNYEMNNIYGTVADSLCNMVDTRYDAVYGDGVNKNTIQSIINNIGNRLLVYSAKQGFHYSKQRSVIWLQGLNHIYIDKIHDPEAYKQFKNFSYKLDKDGNVTSVLKDGDDHLIDATIYSLVRTVEYEN